MRWSHFVQGQSRIAFLRGRWQHQSAASLPMNPNSVILTQLEYELVMCTHKDIEEPELDLQSWKADDWERQKQIFKLCRKVQKKTPKMSISVQTCRAIRNYSLTSWSSTDIWNRRHSWGDSKMEKAVHFTLHSMWVGPTLETNVNRPLPTSSQHEGHRLGQCL